MHVATLDQQDRARRSGLGLTLCFKEMTASGLTTERPEVTCPDCLRVLDRLAAGRDR